MRGDVLNDHCSSAEGAGTSRNGRILERLNGPGPMTATRLIVCICALLISSAVAQASAAPAPQMITF